MFNELMKVVEESNLDKRLSSLFENYKTAVKRFYDSDFAAPFKNLVSSFEDKEDHYELVINVAKEATSKNVEVNLEDNVLSVSYVFKTENSSSSTCVQETLPEDADADTLTATVENGVLLISVDKLPDAEFSDEDEEGDLVNVRINRK